jgi:hypothetical protein
MGHLTLGCPTTHYVEVLPMASIEHGFTDHDSLDLVDWAEHRKFLEEEGEEDEETEDYFPMSGDFIDWDE